MSRSICLAWSQPADAAHPLPRRLLGSLLPALRKVPDAWLFEPWRLPPDLQERYGVQVGVDIAYPLVDLEVATRTAKQRLHALRAQPAVRAAKAAIVAKHGSRQRRSTKSTQPKADSPQLGLEFE